jgi:hypothetical protein
MARRGWLFRPGAQAVEVPEHLLDYRELSYPWTLQEVKPGEPVPMIDVNDLYRRHELVAAEAYLYLRDSSRLADVSEQQIRQLLGPLASKRPTRFEVKPRDLQLIANGIADRTLELHGGCTLIIPSGIWEDASVTTRNVFVNLARIHGVSYRVEDIGLGGPFWQYGHP